MLRVEIIAAEFLVRCGSTKEVIGDLENRAAHGDYSFPVTAAVHQAPVTGDKRGGFGVRGSVAGFDQGIPEPGITAPCFAAAAFAGALVVAGAHSGPA